MRTSKTKIDSKEQERLIDDLSNFGLSGGDYSPISQTFFKKPSGDAQPIKGASKYLKKD